MFVRRIKTGGSINSIIAGFSNGKDCNYPIVDNPRKEIERLTCFANKKIEEGYDVAIKVKYDWEFAQRARIIEVVTTKDGVVTLYKFADITNYDRYAPDLERLKEAICRETLISEDKLKICLVAPAPHIGERIGELLVNMGVKCNVEWI